MWDKIAENAKLSKVELAELARFATVTQNINLQYRFLNAIPNVDILVSSDTDEQYVYNVSGEHKHILLVIQARSLATAILNSYGIRFNDDSSSSYTYEFMYANEGSPTGSTGTINYMFLGYMSPNNAPANASGVYVAFVPNILATMPKIGIVLNHAVDSTGKQNLLFGVSTWSSTESIKRISLTSSAIRNPSCVTMYGFR